MINTINKEWMTPVEVQKEYGFSVSTLAKWRMNNKYLKFSKIGKYIKYKRSDVEEFLTAHIVNVEVA